MYVSETQTCINCKETTKTESNSCPKCNHIYFLEVGEELIEKEAFDLIFCECRACTNAREKNEGSTTEVRSINKTIMERGGAGIKEAGNKKKDTKPAEEPKENSSTIEAEREKDERIRRQTIEREERRRQEQLRRYLLLQERVKKEPKKVEPKEPTLAETQATLKALADERMERRRRQRGK